jgi:hypothetical protein
MTNFDDYKHMNKHNDATVKTDELVNTDTPLSCFLGCFLGWRSCEVES